jgi:hypothetical protein
MLASHLSKLPSILTDALTTEFNYAVCFADLENGDLLGVGYKRKNEAR